MGCRAGHCRFGGAVERSLYPPPGEDDFIRSYISGGEIPASPGPQAHSGYQEEAVPSLREHGAFTFDVDVPTRISAVLGIHQGLGILFPTEQLGVQWLRTPHRAVVFGGRPPLDLVTSGSQDGLLSVRRFLNGARGRLYMQPNAIDEAFAPYDDTEIVFR
jgi:hypothetical protein